MNLTHCDNDACENASRSTKNWYTLTWDTRSEDRLDFCCWACIRAYMEATPTGDVWVNW